MKLDEWISQHKELEQEIIAHRRALHQCPELRFDLPQTRKYIMDTLTAYGYEPVLIADGITATVGRRDGKTLMLRADMDGLATKEATGLPFQSTNGNMHACGHDLHMAVLLGTAKLLKQHEAELGGCVKLLFQPAEEILLGAPPMIEAGVMENPHVDAAMGLHILPLADPGVALYYRKHEMTAISTQLEIKIWGKQCHTSMPHQGTDPINIAVRIYTAFQELIAREVPATSTNILSAPIFQGGTAHNIMPETAYMRCTMRSYKEEQREFIMTRIREICEHTAAAFRGRVEVNELVRCPSVYNDPAFTQQIVDFNREMFGDSLVEREQPMLFSEDYAYFAQKVPSAFFLLAAGTVEDGYTLPLHNEKVTYDEAALMRGCAFMYTGAVSWLKAQ